MIKYHIWKNLRHRFYPSSTLKIAYFGDSVDPCPQDKNMVNTYAGKTIPSILATHVTSTSTR